MYEAHTDLKKSETPEFWHKVGNYIPYTLCIGKYKADITATIHLA